MHPMFNNYLTKFQLFDTRTNEKIYTYSDRSQRSRAWSRNGMTLDTIQKVFCAE